MTPDLYRSHPQESTSAVKLVVSYLTRTINHCHSHAWGATILEPVYKLICCHYRDARAYDATGCTFRPNGEMCKERQE